MNTPNPFPEGLTADALHSLNFQLQNGEPDLADKWVIRVADLIAIGAMRHVADPESFSGVTIPGWTIWGKKKYANHIEAHEAQQIAFQQWAGSQGVSLAFDLLPPDVGFPQGSVLYESLAFRDTDGKSAPSDATDLVPGGWKLFRGAVIAPSLWVEVFRDANGLEVKGVDGLLDEDPPGETGDAVTVKLEPFVEPPYESYPSFVGSTTIGVPTPPDSALRPLRVGDRFIVTDEMAVRTVTEVRAHTADSRNMVCTDFGIYIVDNGDRVVSEEGA